MQSSAGAYGQSNVHNAYMQPSYHPESSYDPQVGLQQPTAQHYQHAPYLHTQYEQNSNQGWQQPQQHAPSYALAQTLHPHESACGSQSDWQHQHPQPSVGHYQPSQWPQQSVPPAEFSTSTQAHQHQQYKQPPPAIQVPGLNMVEPVPGPSSQQMQQHYGGMRAPPPGVTFYPAQDQVQKQPLPYQSNQQHLSSQQQGSYYGAGSPTHQRDMAAAGSFKKPEHVEIPRMGRGMYAGAISSQLQAVDMGMTPQSGAPMVSPGGSNKPRIPPTLNGWERNADVVQMQQAGLTAAHNAKDGINKFEGVYSKAHAGKTSQSSFNKDHTVAKGPYLDDVLPHARQRMAVVELPEAAAAASTPAGMPTIDHNPGLPSTGAPWQKNQVPVAHGVRMLPGALQTQDHLYNAQAGLIAPPGDVQKGRGMQFGRAKQTNIVTGAQGLSHNSESDKALYPSVNRHLLSGGNVSHIVQGPQGLMEGGQHKFIPAPFAGKTNYSVLTGDYQGVHGPLKPYQPMARHAGKISASNIVQGNNGITIMGNVVPQRVPSDGHGHWSTTYDDTYHHLQVGQLQLKQNLQKRNQGPDRF
ncbi:hypothetical protein CEUSTIGMA_g3984.t1 [Chlamydomonas eustigma]|uniref:Uncharacterized protein n=1 Tax=Chlamydomonas eustigma TaxID=1157962 RepID=A0A250X0E5_9CHLO|nr:hypothetical protein CEUSTIGMA_g3984.t1 [Chlamydomonas eustigma]|eukprot:GAX76538.1 hypothetical protein CEUSTIGMA_g3984.t1 [Chlamydomonas eustigma]